MHLSRIEPCHPYPHEHLRPNGTLTRGKNLYARIKSRDAGSPFQCNSWCRVIVDAGSPFRYDVWHQILLPIRWLESDKMTVRSYSNENGIRAGIRHDRQQLLSSKAINHVTMRAMIHHWTREWGGNCWSKPTDLHKSIDLRYTPSDIRLWPTKWTDKPENNYRLYIAEQANATLDRSTEHPSPNQDR